MSNHLRAHELYRLPLYDIETMEALVERRIRGFAVIGNLMGILTVLKGIPLTYSRDLQ